LQVGVLRINTAISPLSPKGIGSRSLCFTRPEFGSVFQVGVLRINTAVSPLSLRERVRVRGF